MINSNYMIEDRFISNQDKYITMVKGDTVSFGVIVEDQEGTPIDVDTIVFVCKKNYNDVNSVFEKTLGDGIERKEEGTYVVRVAPADTASAEPGLYYYNLRVGLDGDKYTVMKGVLEIDPVVTD